MIDEREWTYEDFDRGRVFEYLVGIEDPYEQGMAERRMAAIASEVKFRDFKKLFGLYKKKIKPLLNPLSSKMASQNLKHNPMNLTQANGGLMTLGFGNTALATEGT